MKPGVHNFDTKTLKTLVAYYSSARAAKADRTPEHRKQTAKFRRKLKAELASGKPHARRR